MKFTQNILVIILFFFLNIPIKGQDNVNCDCPYPIIFVHGWAGSEYSWKNFADQLKNVWRGELLIPSTLSNSESSSIYYADLNYNYNSTKVSDDVIIHEDFNSPPSLIKSCIYGISFNVRHKNPSQEFYEFKNQDDPSFDNYQFRTTDKQSDSNESSPFKQGYALGKAIKKILEKSGKKKVILVGHSMGGLAIREYLQRTENGSRKWWAFPNEMEKGHRVARVLTVVTPHRGTNVVDELDDILAVQLGGMDVNSEAVRDMRYYYKKNEDTQNEDSQNYKPGVYLYGGNENNTSITSDQPDQQPISLWKDYKNYDVSCNGEPEDIFNDSNVSSPKSLNEPSSPLYEGSTYNSQMPLPPDIKYTYYVSDKIDLLFSSGEVASDGIVEANRQYLFLEKNGTYIPEPYSEEIGEYGLSDKIITPEFVAHSSPVWVFTTLEYLRDEENEHIPKRANMKATDDIDNVIRGIDEADYPYFAYEVEIGKEYAGLPQKRADIVPANSAHRSYIDENEIERGINTIDVDWYTFTLDKPSKVTLSVQRSDNLACRIGLTHSLLSDEEKMNNPEKLSCSKKLVTNGIFENLNSEICLEAGQHYFRIIHAGIKKDSWRTPYKFKIDIQDECGLTDCGNIASTSTGIYIPYPSSNESYVTGQDVPICYSTGSDVSKVTIKYETASGHNDFIRKFPSKSENINVSAGVHTAYWNIPEGVSGKVKIRIYSSTNTTIEGFSDEFEINSSCSSNLVSYLFNSRSTTNGCYINSPPDWTITNITPSNLSAARTNLSVAKGTSFDVTFTIKNNAEYAPPNQVNFYLVGNGINQSLGYAPINFIPAGGSINRAFRMTIPSNMANGSYSLKAIVDEPNEVNETNEGNNIHSSTQIQVTNPIDNSPTSINLSTSLSPSTVNPFQVVTVSGSATYNTGDKVQNATVTISLGSEKWTTPINSDGTYSVKITAGENSNTVYVSINDGTLSKTTTKYLTVQLGSGAAQYSLNNHTITKAVTNYLPASPTTHIKSSDSRFYSWLELDNVATDLVVKWDIYLPDGSIIETGTESVPNQFGGYYRVWYYFPIDGYGHSDKEGKWTIKVSVKPSGGSYKYLFTDYFYLSYDFQENRISKGIQNDYPVNETNTFLNTDSRVYTWARFTHIHEEVNLRVEWIQPNGNVYEPDIETFDIPNPGNEPQAWYPEVTQWFYLDIKNYPPANYCGNWKVKYYEKDPFGNWDLLYTDNFKIVEANDTKPYVSMTIVPSIPFENETILFLTNASDNCTLDKVKIWWNTGGANWNSQTWDNLNVEELEKSKGIGNHPEGTIITYYIQAWDISGNVNESEIKSTIVKDSDVTGPSISNLNISDINGNNDGVFQDNERLDFSATISDPSGISNVEFYIDGSLITLNGNYSANKSNLAAGTHTFQIIALDNDNSKAISSASIGFTVELNCIEREYYLDSDNDGFGDIFTSIINCVKPNGYVSNPSDCDDTNPNIHSGAKEVCDGLDNNCDGQIDEGDACSENCAENWTITDAQTSIPLFQAVYYITTSGIVTVASNEELTFEAEYIDLNDGFDTESGAFFEAKVDPCILNNLEEATPRNIPTTTTTSKKDIPCNSIMNIFPNPFQNQTNIEIYLNEDSPIALKLFTLTGQEITTILNRDFRPQGYHNISLTKLSISSGIYICSLTTNNCTVSKQIIIQ